MVRVRKGLFTHNQRKGGQPTGPGVQDKKRTRNWEAGRVKGPPHPHGSKGLGGTRRDSRGLYNNLASIAP